MSSALDRQIRPIYDALDTQSNKSAVLACNKVLKKHPTNVLVKALKALALVRLQKVEESLLLADEVLATKPIDDGVLTAMMHVLRGLGRHLDIVTMFETAYKQNPQNEDLGTQTFFANVRVGNWKAGQQVATKMHKQFQDDRYLYWSVFSAVLQANDVATPENMRPILLKLAIRLIGSASTPSYVSPDRFFVHLLVLRELEQFDDAGTLLDHEIGQRICQTSLACDEIRRDIAKLRGRSKEEGELASKRISEKKDRNWLEFLSVLDATFYPLTSSSDPASDEVKASVSEQVAKARQVFTDAATEDGPKDRSGLLALLELEKRTKSHGLTSDAPDLRSQAENYFAQFGDKACCYEDLQPYVTFEGDDNTQWVAFLESSKPFTHADSLQRSINAHKLLRYNLSSEQLTSELEAALAKGYVENYLEALKFGSSLPDTELQPSDDFALLAGHAYVSLWKLTKDESHLQSAVSILEYASARSKQSYKIRLVLIRLYHLLAAPSLALEHYRLMNVKQVQTDTLSHLVLSRAATWSLAPLGDITYMSECMESSQIYMSNSTETADFIARAFSTERYSQIIDFIEFEDRLDNSLQRDLMKVEHVRMRVAHEPLNAELVDMELIELKFIFDRIHHDNRDFEIIPNYQPRGQPSLNEQTLSYKPPGAGWLSAYLKMYIRAFQQASDLDDSVEDKLLIGDRPKPSNDPENQQPLRERLIKKKDEEVEDLSEDEKLFYEYASALSEWVGPYHDHVRPPPSALLAEAAKANDLKPGHPLKALAQEANGSPSNGQPKKNEEPPAIKDAPVLVTKFFDDMKARFDKAVEDKALPSELLHVVAIIQEAYLLFALETIRFKQNSVVKQYRFGQLAQSFKDIRAKSSPILTGISEVLAKMAEEIGTAEGRKAFVDASSSIQASSGFDHDFVLNVAKKATDARKQVLDGISKGLGKVVKNHS